MSKELIRILLADDHVVVREGLAAMIRREPDMQVAGEAADGLEALALCRSLAPDVVLLDARMPGMDGIDAAAAIRDACPGSRTIVLTTYDNSYQIHRALRSGARAYLLKQMPGARIIEAIRTVHNGGRVVPPEVTERLIDYYETEELSSRELEILVLMATGARNKEIAGSLHIAEGTVKGHVMTILSKLRAADRTQAVMIGVQRRLIPIE